MEIEVETKIRRSGDGDSWVLAIPNSPTSEYDVVVEFGWPGAPTRTLPKRGRFQGARYNVRMEFRRELSEDPSIEVREDTTRIASRAEYPFYEGHLGIELLDLPDESDYQFLLRRNSRFIEQYPDWVTDRDATYGVVLEFRFDERATLENLHYAPTPKEMERHSNYLDHTTPGVHHWQVSHGEPTSVSLPDATGNSVLAAGMSTLYGIDAEQGSVQWEAAIEDIDAEAAAGAADDILCYEGEGIVYGLAADSGAAVWQMSADGVYGQLTGDDDRLLIHDNEVLRALDRTDGAIQWELSAPAHPAESINGIVTDGETVCLHGAVDAETDALVTVDAVTGDLKWVGEVATIDGSVDVAGSNIYYTTSDDDGSTLTALNVETGERCWTVAIDADSFLADQNAVVTFSSVAVHDDHPADGPFDVAVGRDPTTGDLLWDHPVAGEIRSDTAPAIEDGVVHLTSTEWYGKNTTYAVNMTTGETVWQYEFRVTPRADTTVAHNDLVFVSQETRDLDVLSPTADTRLSLAGVVTGAVDNAEHLLHIDIGGDASDEKLVYPRRYVPGTTDVAGTAVTAMLSVADERSAVTGSGQRESPCVTEFTAEVFEIADGLVTLELAEIETGQDEACVRVSADRLPDWVQTPGDQCKASLYLEFKTVREKTQ